MIAAFAAGTLWYLFTVPWGIAVHQLVMFTAPGALLGLAFAWASSSFEPFRYTWSRARRAAINGAVFLPPLLAFLVVLAGNTRPQRLLVGVVYGAWTALLGGMALAVLRPERAMLTTGRRALSGSVVRHSEQP